MLEPAGATVGHDPFGVQGAEIGAGGDVPRAEMRPALARIELGQPLGVLRGGVGVTGRHLSRRPALHECAHGADGGDATVR